MSRSPARRPTRRHLGVACTPEVPAHPLCAEADTGVDIARSCWTFVDSDVTCPRCLALKSERVVAAERHQTFRVGFVDGARACAKATAFEGHRLQPDYDRGYEAGLRARNQALTAHAAEVGHKTAGAMLREGDGL